MSVVRESDGAGDVFRTAAGCRDIGAKPGKKRESPESAEQLTRHWKDHRELYLCT